MKLTKIISIIFFILFLSTIYDLSPKILFAQTFDSDSYHIDWGNFNMTAGSKTSPAFNLTDTVGQMSPGQYTSPDFTVKSGFQYIHDLVLRPFSFRIDNLAINLGVLVPNIGSSATNTITITTPSGQGYQILVASAHPLQVDAQTQIPATICDNGLCTPDSSQVWITTDAFGFGFNAIGVNSSGTPTGIGTSSYFNDSTYFRPFADISQNQSAQTIMSENSAVNSHSARITYKALISTTQVAGDYETNISFIAVPKY